ncbi:MAG: FtsX-like permease family protein [Bacteroidota bacterium]
MSYELFIAKRISGKNQENKGFTKPILNIAITAIALGVAVMIISIAVVTGFKKEIINKVVGFGSHIQITSFENNNSLELSPIIRNNGFIKNIKKIEGVSNIQTFATKAGIIKTDDEIFGVSIKGISKDFNWDFFKSKIVSGKTISFKDTVASDDMLISKYISSKLQLKINDKIKMYFIIDNKLRARVFNLVGIYESGFEELDKTFVLSDIKHIQKLNNWNDNQIGGYEILINNINKLDKINQSIYQNIDQNLNTKTIKEIRPEIFNWLDFLNVNISVILILMIIVAAINMISSLLIIILEQTNMIGLLKSFGARNKSIRKIFIYNSFFILLKGIIWGNIIGIGICILQYYTGIIKLDQATYYVSSVPIYLEILPILALNIGTVIICIILMVVPSAVISKISPMKTIRYE